MLGQCSWGRVFGRVLEMSIKEIGVGTDCVGYCKPL